MSVLHHSIQGFYVALYEEHLEEASFLYEQCITMQHEVAQDLVKWTDLSAFEDRLEAHLDALMIGDELAWSVCQDRAESGDFGELFATICVACRRNTAVKPTWQWVRAQVNRLDAEEDDFYKRLHAIANALVQEMPIQWQALLVQEADTFDTRWMYLFATMAFELRWEMPDILRALILNCTDEETTLRLFQALKQSRDPQIQPFLQNKGLASEVFAIQEQSVWGLLQFGSLQMLAHLGTYLPQHSWAWLAIGVSGGRAEQARIRTFLQDEIQAKKHPEAYLAFGLLGGLDTISDLLQGLKTSETAYYAALGLYAITGAPLWEMQEELIEAEDAEDNEVQAKVTISQSIPQWQTWIQANQAQFQVGLCYRGGVPMSPEANLRLLGNEECPHLLRWACNEEFAIRYNMPLAINLNATTQQQRKQMQQIATYLSANPALPAGKRYFSRHALG